MSVFRLTKTPRQVATTMHILFVHKNFPAQFGQVARHLVLHESVQCTFVCEHPSGVFDGVRRLQYKIRGGARKQTHYCSRSFENFTWHSHAVYETLKAHPEIKPDLVVGHSGFGSTAFLADLYDCPIINYFEWYYHPRNSEMDFRPDQRSHELNVLRARARNAMLLLDLQTCTAGYCPTNWQRSRFPHEYQPKLTTIYDGIDTAFWRPRPEVKLHDRRIGDKTISAETKIVTYVSRGFESMRGFDVFMQVAKRICDERKDVIFVCVGSDRVCYGDDHTRANGLTYREHILRQDNYDLSRFIFTGMVPPQELARIFNLSDLHIYLTAPFVLSWSMMNALACGCTVLASDTPPVREMITHGQNGLLAGFRNVEQLSQRALDVIGNSVAYTSLGKKATELIASRHKLNEAILTLLGFYRSVSGSIRGGSGGMKVRPSNRRNGNSKPQTPNFGASSDADRNRTARRRQMGQLHFQEVNSEEAPSIAWTQPCASRECSIPPPSEVQALENLNTSNRE